MRRLLAVLAVLFLMGCATSKKWDVTAFVPGQGPVTVVIDTPNWKMRDGCFYPSNKRQVICNILQVIECTENCEPPQEAPPAPPEQPKQGQAKPSSIARN